MDAFDKDGTTERKPKSGRPPKFNEDDLKKLKKSVDHRTGMSQRKLATKFNVSQPTIGRSLQKIGIEYKPRVRAPKATPGQKDRQVERLAKLCGGDGLFSMDDDREIIIDDESYFTLTGAGMPGNKGYYTSNSWNTPEEVKFQFEEKFPEKVMIWGIISSKGIGDIYVAPKRTSMDSALYRKECLSRVLKFVDANYESREDVIFWPDLAPCHYSHENLEWLEQNGITFVPKDQNPPAAPQIRPIENFWGCLKMKVYEGNWQAKNREQLIRKIKKCVKEFDQNVIRNMFENLKSKIHFANENGLSSLN